MIKKIKMYFFWDKVKRYYRYFKRNIVIYKSDNIYTIASYYDGKLIDSESSSNLESAKDIARTYMLKRIKECNRQNRHVKW